MGSSSLFKKKKIWTNENRSNQIQWNRKLDRVDLSQQVDSFFGGFGRGVEFLFSLIVQIFLLLILSLFFYFYVSYLYSFQSFSFSEFIECQSPFASITSSLCQVGLALLLSNCAFRLGYFYCNIYLLHNNYKYGNDNMIKVCNQISHLIFAFFSWSNSSSLTVFNIKGVAILFLFKFFFFFLKKIYLLWSLIIIKYFHTCHYYRLW